MPVPEGWYSASLTEVIDRRDKDREKDSLRVQPALSAASSSSTTTTTATTGTSPPPYLPHFSHAASVSPQSSKSSATTEPLTPSPTTLSSLAAAAAATTDIAAVQHFRKVSPRASRRKARSSSSSVSSGLTRRAMRVTFRLDGEDSSDDDDAATTKTGGTLTSALRPPRIGAGGSCSNEILMHQEHTRHLYLTHSHQVDQSWRRAGRLYRAKMIQRDEESGGTCFDLSDDCSIRRYHQVAKKVLDQFVISKAEENANLKDMYLVGTRLHKFVSVVLPTHKDFFSEDQETIALRSQTNTQLMTLTKCLEELAFKIDERQFQKVQRERDADKETPPKSEVEVGAIVPYSPLEVEEVFPSGWNDTTIETIESYKTFTATQSPVLNFSLLSQDPCSTPSTSMLEDSPLKPRSILKEQDMNSTLESEVNPSPIPSTSAFACFTAHSFKPRIKPSMASSKAKLRDSYKSLWGNPTWISPMVDENSFERQKEESPQSVVELSDWHGPNSSKLPQDVKKVRKPSSYLTLLEEESCGEEDIGDALLKPKGEGGSTPNTRKHGAGHHFKECVRCLID